MAYYVGCPVPRVDDCGNGVKCIKGEFCEHLRILNDKEENVYTRYEGENARLFEDIREARKYIEQLRIRYLE